MHRAIERLVPGVSHLITSRVEIQQVETGLVVVADDP
jgi:hypothetical protein